MTMLNVIWRMSNDHEWCLTCFFDAEWRHLTSNQSFDVKHSAWRWKNKIAAGVVLRHFLIIYDVLNFSKTSTIFVETWWITIFSDVTWRHVVYFNIFRCHFKKTIVLSQNKYNLSQKSSKNWLMIFNQNYSDNLFI